MSSVMPSQRTATYNNKHRTGLVFKIKTHNCSFGDYGKLLGNDSLLQVSCYHCGKL